MVGITIFDKLVALIGTISAPIYLVFILLILSTNLQFMIRPSDMKKKKKKKVKPSMLRRIAQDLANTGD